MTQITFIALLLIGLAGCGGGRNTDCEWPAGGPGLSLSDSVRLAEDLAIRYADARDKRDSWRSDREACEAKLFETIGRQQDTTLAEIARIRQGFGRRGPDLPVYGPMLALCALAAWWLVHATARRFGASEPLAWAIALIGGTVVIAVAIIGIGQVWAGVVETIRVGNGHLSYRASRIPWGQHRLVTGVAVALVVFFMFALQRRRSADGRERSKGAAV